MSNNFPPIHWIHPSSGDWPSFSPDGKQVVFTLDNALYVMSSDGTNVKRLYPDKETSGVSATRPDWSWNPDAIAFARNGEIWTIHPDGSGAAPYYKGTLEMDATVVYPSWCKDLKSLIAVAYYKENDAQQAVLVQMAPDWAHVLTTSPHPCAGRPSVSPSGLEIAFAGNWGKFSQAENQIWVKLAVSEPFRLEPGEPLSAFQGRSPNWSPDGNRIVFESTRPAPNPAEASLAIWVMDRDGLNPHQLTDPKLFSASHPEWSRQQTQIVFAGAGQGIGIMEVE